MRTIEHVPAHERCGHCSLPDALHTTVQRAMCERRMLADLSRSWPRTMKSKAERDALAVKKLRSAVDAIAEATHLVELSTEERTSIARAVDVLGAHLARRTA